MISTIDFLNAWVTEFSILDILLALLTHKTVRSFW